jgi:hypothetical protein
VKPAKEIRVGDALEVTIRSVKRTVEVTGVSDKRGPAAAAAALYVEAPESISARQEAALERRWQDHLAPIWALGRRSSPADAWKQCAAPTGTGARLSARTHPSCCRRFHSASAPGA